MARNCSKSFGRGKRRRIVTRRRRGRLSIKIERPVRLKNKFKHLVSMTAYSALLINPWNGFSN